MSALSWPYPVVANPSAHLQMQDCRGSCCIFLHPGPGYLNGVLGMLHGNWFRGLGFRRRNLAAYPIRPFVRVLTKSGILSREFVAGSCPNVEFSVRVDGYVFRYHLEGIDPVGSILYWQSWEKWEPAVVRAFLRWLPGARRVIDIGANTGFYSLLAGASGAEVHAVEANPVTCQRLCENLGMNDFEQRYRIHPGAAGVKHGEVIFYLHEDPTCCSVVEKSDKAIRVPVLRLDEHVPIDGKTDLIKIDVEGFEDETLAGLAAILADSHPKLIFECYRRRCTAPVEALLKDLGYRLSWISPKGELVPIERLEVGIYKHGEHNFAATSSVKIQVHQARIA
jgi:FkbM family methyltransferase